jgi:hypothetical protein
VIRITRVTVNVRLTLSQATKTHRGSRGIALSGRSAPRPGPLYPEKETRYATYRRLWPVWTGAENLAPLPPGFDPISQVARPKPSSETSISRHEQSITPDARLPTAQLAPHREHRLSYENHLWSGTKTYVIIHANLSYFWPILTKLGLSLQILLQTPYRTSGVNSHKTVSVVLLPTLHRSSAAASSSANCSVCSQHKHEHCQLLQITSTSHMCEHAAILFPS